LANRPPQNAEQFLRHLEPLQTVLEGYCRRVLYRASDIEDVLQSAIANALRDFDLYVEGTNFRAWIFRYVDYEARNRNRAARRARHEPLSPDLAALTEWDTVLERTDWETLLDEPERVLDHCDEAVNDAVRQLPDLERRVFLLRALGGFKYREIADILEVPVGTVMGSLSRGRARLRQRLLGGVDPAGGRAGVVESDSA
jgi:RNA polymerase sigma-70 factor (ECF subfamily)